MGIHLINEGNFDTLGYCVADKKQWVDQDGLMWIQLN